MFSLCIRLDRKFSVRVPRARVRLPPSYRRDARCRPRSGFRFTDTAGQYFQYPLFDIMSTTRLTYQLFKLVLEVDVDPIKLESALWSFRPPAPSREK